ncbi:MAG: hypothetical protein KDC42_02275 [Ignavibacteriae bacterium]|nr:hypothetical protein [Ignavibacteriota bacterium]
MDFDQYLTSLDGWSAYHGFKKMDIQPGLDVDRMFYKESSEASKMGVVDRFLYIKKVPDNINAEWVRKFSSGLFEYSRQYKQTFGRFFRSMMIVNPVMAVDTISRELYDFIMSYCPKQFKAMEFPAILQLSTNDLYLYQKTPFWGALYYDGIRKSTSDYFSPKRWEQISASQKA